LHTVAPCRRQTVDRAPEDELRPAPFAFTPDDTCFVDMAQFFGPPQIEWCQNSVLKCDHRFEISSANHDVTEHVISIWKVCTDY